MKITGAGDALCDDCYEPDKVWLVKTKMPKDGQYIKCTDTKPVLVTREYFENLLDIDAAGGFAYVEDNVWDMVAPNNN